MMKEEFETLLGKPVSSQEYELIEFVYTYHPSISDTDGKKQIVDLYKTGGMLVIEGMMEATRFAKNIEDEQRALLDRMNMLKERMADVKDGHLDFERCLSDMKIYFEKSKDISEFNRCQKLFIESKYSISHIKRAKEMLGVK